MKIIFSTAILLLTLLNVDAADSVGAPKIRELAKGGFSGIQKPVQLVITNQAQWQETWNQHIAGRGNQPLPAVDFARETVLFVTLGRRNTGGYSIRIDSVEQKGDTLLARITTRQPSKGSMTLQAITAPFYAAAVDVKTARIEFVSAP